MTNFPPKYQKAVARAMIRQTRKYLEAKKITPNFKHESSAELYRHLEANGYYWESDTNSWYHLPEEKRSEASKVIRVRVLTDRNEVESVAETVADVLKSHGFKLLEKSEMYPCRPPKINDGRVYLTFE